MKSWQDFLNESDLNRPLDDLNRYFTGITNRLMLMQPEEIDSWRHKLTELRNLIDQKLNQ
ncbi:MAG: hypothetical protein DWQ19_09930 [Crenarchaeota archaeon]|nr:MAG: hypothetical protein DWQ19_09930 [Thermoproteota archaeon]